MSNNVISQRPILNTPADVLSYTMNTYLLDGRATERLAEVDRRFRDIIQDMREGLWNELQNEPRINHYIKHSSLIEKAPTIKLKMNALADILNTVKGRRHPSHRRFAPQNPGDDLRKFGELTDLDGQLDTAYELGDEGLFDSFNLNVVPYSGIKSTTCKAAKDGAIEKVKKLLPYLQRDDIDWALSNAIEYGHMNIIQYIFKKRTFNKNDFLNSATYHNKPNVIRFALESGGYGTGYFHSGEINADRLHPGLQYNIIHAIDGNKPECLDALLEGNPSLEILEHARDRALFIKIFWIADHVLPGESLIGNTNVYWHNRDKSLDPKRDALRDAVPERFRNREIYSNMIKRGSRTEMIQKLEKEIARRRAPSIVIEEIE